LKSIIYVQAVLINAETAFDLEGITNLLLRGDVKRMGKKEIDC